MKSLSVMSLNTFDQQLNQLLSQPTKSGFDIMHYDDYFNERPPPIKTQNNFSDFNKSMANLQRYNQSGSQYGGSKAFPSELPGLNDNNTLGSHFLKSNQSYANGLTAQDKHNGTNGSYNPLNDYIKPNFTELIVQSTVHGPTGNKLFGNQVKTSNPFINGQSNGISSQTKFEGFNSKALGSKNQQPDVSTYDRFNIQNISKKLDAFNTNLSDNINNGSYFEKPNTNHKQQQDAVGRSNYQKDQLDISKSPNPDSSRIYNNYLTNIANKYGQVSIDNNYGPAITNDVFKSHLMSKKVSSR